MKHKSTPVITQSTDSFEYSCLKGLSPAGRLWAKNEIKKRKKAGEEDIFYGIIRAVAIKME